MTSNEENLPISSVEETSYASLDVDLDTEVKLNIIEKFPSLAKDETARIALIAFNPDNGKNTPMLKLSQYYYVEVSETNKIFFAAPKSKEMLAKVIRHYGEPKVRFGTIIIRYDTDKSGALMKSADGSVNFKYYVWLIGQDKWNSLKSLHAEWNLYGRDLILKWDGKSDIKFQNLLIQPAQDGAWKHLPDAKAIANQGYALYQTALQKHLAREISDDDLAIKLGWETMPQHTNTVDPFAKGKSPAKQIAEQTSTTTAENPFNKIVKPQ